MAHSNHHNLTEDELAGRWVAVYGNSDHGEGGISLSSGAVVVDYDTELDLLCQRVAAAGQSGLTIYRYPGEHPAFYSDRSHYLPGHRPGQRGRA